MRLILNEKDLTADGKPKAHVKSIMAQAELVLLVTPDETEILKNRHGYHGRIERYEALAYLAD